MVTEIARLESHDVEYVYLSGKPSTVVFVNGSGGPLLSWFGLIADVSAEHNVLAYNRAGIGRSSAAELPQTASEMARELHSLISYLDIDGVIVLVGHSLGGLVALQFCLSFPRVAKGIVLLEPSTIWDIDNQKSLPKDRKNPNGELNFVRQSAEQLRDLSRFPKIPSVVGIGTKSSLVYWIFRRVFDARRSNLRRLAADLGSSRVVEFTRSGHFPQINEPKKTSDLVRQLCNDVVSSVMSDEA